MRKIVYESVSDLLKPKGISDVLADMKSLSVNDKISNLIKMRDKWGGMYKDLINNKEIKNDIIEQVKIELNKLDLLDKIEYIEKLENEFPDIFTGMKDKKLINELKSYIVNQDFEIKSKLVYRFFKSWPDLFKDVDDDPKIDKETNQLLLLFKIKGAIDSGEINKLQEFIHEMGEKYGRKNILDKAEQIRVDGGLYGEKNLFNKKDIQQLKLSLYKETRDEEETARDEYFNVYAFIGYEDSVEVVIGGRKLYDKRLGIENLVKINKYDSSSLNQVSMMKIRATTQYGGTGVKGAVYGVYIPKYMWDKDYAYNNDIKDDLRQFIDENKFKF